MFKFELPREQSSIIKVIGVGGGGSNAVNYMFRQQIKGVDFIVCNTDGQSLEMSPVPTKIQLGSSLTQGLGAGAIPEVGRNAAIENIEEIKAYLSQNTKMVFITAGMGGGTGTGAAPVIAQVAKDMGILTVGIVTIPFSFEGKKRKQQAEEGLENMRKAVDTLLVINNDKLREMYGNLTLANAFGQADEVLNTAARGIAEMISVTGLINVDFNDVNTVMRNSGVAIMGSATANGENRARVAVEKALSSPLLNDNHIAGAKYVLLNITYGTQEVTMDEIAEITDFIQEEAGATADVIWGHGFDESLGDGVLVTVIATGFNRTPDTGISMKLPEKNKVTLVEDQPTMITSPIVSATQMSSPTSSLEKTVEPYLKNAGPETTPVVEKEVSFDEPVLKVIESPVAESKIETPVSEFTSEVAESKEEEVIRHTLDIETNEFEFTVETSSEEKTSLNTTPVAETIQPLAEPKIESFVSESRKEEIISEEPKKEVIRHWLTEEDMNDVTNESSTSTPSMEKTSEPVAESKPEVRAENQNQRVQASLFNVENIDPEKEKMLSAEEQQRRANERMARIKELSSKLKTPTGLNDLESEPAYLRRNVTLIKTQHSSESNVSKYSVNEEKDEKGNKNGGLRSNNSFLHDNVD